MGNLPYISETALPFPDEKDKEYFSKLGIEFRGSCNSFADVTLPKDIFLYQETVNINETNAYLINEKGLVVGLIYWNDEKREATLKPYKQEKKINMKKVIKQDNMLIAKQIDSSLFERIHMIQSYMKSHAEGANQNELDKFYNDFNQNDFPKVERLIVGQAASFEKPNFPIYNVWN